MSRFLTQQLVEETLRLHRKDPSINVVEFNTNDGSKKGDNYASNVYSLTVTIDTNGVRERLQIFAKCMPENESRIHLNEMMGVFPKEATAYIELFPDMVQVQRKRGVKDVEVPSAPVLYNTDIARANRVLLFENLQVDGYRMADKMTGCDYSHCQLVMRELAKIHALSYVLKKEEGKSIYEMYPTLSPSDQDPMVKGFVNMLVKGNETAAGFVESMDNGRHKSLAERMKKLDTARVAQEVLTDMTSDEEWNLLAHGDCWINNMLFKYSSSDDVQHPQSLKFVDFQICRSAAPTLDLTYFFYTSTGASLRRQHFDQLLEEYHTTFHAVLKKMEVKFEDFTLEKLKKLFARHRYYGYLFACFALPLMLAQPENAVSMDDVQTAESGGFGELIMQSVGKMKHTHFNTRLLEMAQEMADHGAL